MTRTTDPRPGKAAKPRPNLARWRRVGERFVVTNDHGAFVFLEPVTDPGFGGRGQRLIAPAVGRLAGWRPDRDVPALVRDAHLVMSELVRTPMPRYVWPLTDLVEGRAHHRVAP